jgi:RNA polymerase sigma factor (sigma-70 family)
MTGLNSCFRRALASRPAGCRLAGAPQGQQNGGVPKSRRAVPGDIFAAHEAGTGGVFRGAPRVGIIPGVENPIGGGIQRAKWVLTERALQQFLAYLDPDQDRAGEKYEEIRRKLMTFFRCNGFWNAEDHVDETMDRVIRRLSEVEIRDLMPFIRGVAKHVASEVRRRAPKEIPVESTLELASPSQTDEKGERRFSRRLECVYKCADRLPPGDREIILQYYQYDKSQKIENKRTLAAVFGITAATLRVRAFRARKQLEILVMECMKDFPEDET